jgi:AAHS family 4-hydroxybenzoate transporter-like MFS transporter
LASKIDLAVVLERSRIGPLQIRVFLLCVCCLVMDGFDVQAMGYAAPYVLREWSISSVQMAAVFVAANLGVLVGSIGSSLTADLIGRRPVILTATLFFGAMTLATARADTLTALLWLRFIGGIGLGSVIPNATALIAEFSPVRRRSTLVMCITVGFTGGGAIGGFVAAWLIPLFGWRSVFYVGGAIPMAIGLVMLVALPESPRFLAVHRRRLDLLARWVNAIDPGLHADASSEYIIHEERRPGMLAIRLFDSGRGLITPLLWVVNFMNLLNLYALSNWLATVVSGMGYPQRTAVLVSTVLQVGGTLGTFGLAWAIARRGFTVTLIATFSVATLSIAAIGHPGLSLAALFVIVFVAGSCILGAQPALNALAANVYPTYLRSTGVGWALGIGRLGAIVGPYIGGLLIANHWTTQQMFVAAAGPAAVSAIIMVVLSQAGVQTTAHPTAAPSQAGL